MNKIRFITFDEVKYIHKNQIENYGGSYGIRDEGLLLSALAMASAGFGLEYYHKDIFHMAAAYCFHLCQNHPFVDGNKRVALATALIFLDLNGITIIDPDKILYDTVINLASGKLSKDELSEIIKSLAL
jgi:death-on-curing protein